MEKQEQDYNLIDWFTKVVVKNYANFDGRARRKEYWYFVLVNIILSIIVSFIDGAAGLTFGPAGSNGILGTVLSLALLIPSIAVAIRRMHDVGKSGWFILIPIYNLILACTDGEQGPNQYGPDPKSNGNEINEIGSAQ